MKSVIYIFLFSLLITSCGNSKEEQLVIDYEANGLKSNFNININDTDFKIHSIEEYGEIKASDSLSYYKNKLNDLWSPIKTSDTISFEYVLDDVNRVIKSYDDLIIAYIKAGNDLKTYKTERESKKWRKIKIEILDWKYFNDVYSKNRDSVLSYRYKANTSMTNPLLKIKQTFNKIYYTNSSRSEIIKSEKI